MKQSHLNLLTAVTGQRMKTPELRLYTRLTTILPLPFLKGQGRGEGSGPRVPVVPSTRDPRHHLIPLAWRLRLAFLALLLGSVSVLASDNTNLNHLSLSARFGFNISARFSGMSTLPMRITPRGDRYNYDDGYVLTDISGNYNHQTWYWGYDNSASQISGNNILLSRSTISGATTDNTLRDDPSYGAELVYRRQLGAGRGMKYGIEAAANYQNLSMSGNSSGSANLTRTTDAYPYTAGTTPPTATPGASYQGSYEGPGFVIGDTPVSSSTTYVPAGATITSDQHFDADIWGFRLGPYLDIPVADRLSLSLSGGLAVGLVNPSVSWTETAVLNTGSSASASGSGTDFRALWGGYAAGTVTYDFNERWSIIAGVQFQLLQDYNHSFAGQEVKLDLRSAFYLTLGVSYSF